MFQIILGFFGYIKVPKEAIQMSMCLEDDFDDLIQVFFSIGEKTPAYKKLAVHLEERKRAMAVMTAFLRSVGGCYNDPHHRKELRMLRFGSKYDETGNFTLIITDLEGDRYLAIPLQDEKGNIFDLPGLFDHLAKQAQRTIKATFGERKDD